MRVCCIAFNVVNGWCYVIHLHEVGIHLIAGIVETSAIKDAQTDVFHKFLVCLSLRLPNDCRFQLPRLPLFI